VVPAFLLNSTGDRDWMFSSGGGASYRVRVSADFEVIGDDPLVDGMRIAVRFRRDFVVTDAERLLAAARGAFIELNPGATDDDAVAAVTCAADAVYTVLERDGLFGDGADDALTLRASDGLVCGGSIAQVTFDDPQPLPVGGCFFGVQGDVFALPPGSRTFG
jgi:hypothetical protein